MNDEDMNIEKIRKGLFYNWNQGWNMFNIIDIQEK